MTSPRAVLVTDSCCDLPAALVAERGIEVLSFPYVLDGEEHFDDLGLSLSPSQYYEALRNGSEPTTSQIPFPSYIECFERHASAGDHVVFLAFSSALSGSFETALRARDHVMAQHPGSDIQIVDTRRASIAEGALVLAAADLRDSGATALQIAEWAVVTSDRVRGFFTLETLDHLQRGGRISNVARVAGAMLDIRPVLVFSEEGALVIDSPVRGRKRSLHALADAVEKYAPKGPDARIIIGDADSHDVDRLVELVVERRPSAEIVRCSIGPVIGAHTGPGMAAVAFIEDTE